MRTSALICLILVASRLRESRCGPRYPSKAAELFRTKGEGLRGVRAEGSIMATPSPLRHETTRADSVFRDGDGPRRISKDDYTTTEEDESRNGFEASTFNPDVLNKFLEEYASKIKGSTEKYQRYPFRIVKPSEPLPLEVDEQQTTVRSPIIDHQEQNTKYEEEAINSTSTEDGLAGILNDTIKRNKYYGANSYDDRNGWVTLEAIPWSKSKISKWQATPSTQRPWPEVNKPWDKPGKPWTSDYSVRPIYENNKPWYEKPKPSWPENGQNDKPAWQKPNRPSPYYTEKPEETQAQKWPPERPSWNKYTDRPSLNTDIITDNRPANFPSNWNRPQPTKPSYQYLDRYPDKYQGEEGNDWHDFPTRLEDRPTPRPTTTERPTAFSHYQYVNNHPQSYPGNGDGQWVLLSTNRGYSKSRQRSIKIDSIGQVGNVTRDVGRKEEEADPAVAVMTSKRQVRLTVIDQRVRLAVLQSMRRKY
ncbi:uncharacterized protein LOC100578345 isoform X3 [Apis mellifera]|uniref:Uncharacterized protein LOC100578345 isoform X3 n=1 Tax=Apis mellifera TaxID=7460 RepID=A0A7M7MNA2_APIME|nr:uncharacterized protein LOC100578345 isoform X3 [Apis mellifera]|eukprot:XP_026298530.1 uncharacterized protein LOC100578345 isoform X3 [Apis mellifera]